MKRLVAIVLPFALASFACAHDVVLPDLVTDSACGDGVVEPGEACDTTSDGCVQCEITPGWNCDGSGLLQRPEDDPHQVAFEAAEGFLVGLALGPLLGQVGAGGGMHPGLGQDDDVQHRVQLAVAEA